MHSVVKCVSPIRRFDTKCKSFVAHTCVNAGIPITPHQRCQMATKTMPSPVVMVVVLRIYLSIGRWQSHFHGGSTGV